MLLATSKAEQNQAAIDPWTAVHLAAGLAAGLMGFGFVASMVAAVGYELAEQLAERQGWGQELFQTSGPERPANALVDVGMFAVGHRLGAAYNDTGP